MTTESNRSRPYARRISLATGPVSAALLLLAALLNAPRAAAQSTILIDAPGDELIRRTDDGNDGPINPLNQRLPDLLEIRSGAFSPNAPHANPFMGQWSLSGEYLRVDLVFNGLVNPPGPIGWDDDDPRYEPLAYGPNPVFGFIEFDMDADENTGGELSSPQYRYLGAIGRFGGLPNLPHLAGRYAPDAWAFDGDVTTGPLVERSGEEFHIALFGEEVEEIEVRQEAPGGNCEIFEAGEIWDLEGDFFHRAHAFDEQAFLCLTRPGKYMPEVNLRFAHSLATNRTTVSLIYPFTNLGSAHLDSPNTPPESINGCERDQNSIEEALFDLKFSATFLGWPDRYFPEFDLLAGWEFNNVSVSLDPTIWRVLALVGTAYPENQYDGAALIWTDVFPNPLVGDFNGDGLIDAADTAICAACITDLDGGEYDDDAQTNGTVDWYEFAENFCLFDTDYDGIVASIAPNLLGDMDIDNDVDLDDLDDFVLALLYPDQYTLAHEGLSPLVHGDFTHDGLFDARDIAGFAEALLESPPPPFSNVSLGDLDLSDAVNLDDQDVFVLALTDPNAYSLSQNGVHPRTKGNLNQDGRFDGRDLALFVPANRIM